MFLITTVTGNTAELEAIPLKVHNTCIHLKIIHIHYENLHIKCNSEQLKKLKPHWVGTVLQSSGMLELGLLPADMMVMHFLDMFLRRLTSLLLT
jgi:hypothetical protein